MSTNTTLVKICGLQSWEMIKYVMSLPVDMIGLMFARSRRQVDVEEAGEWVRQARKQNQSTQFVGVFMNPSQSELEHTLAKVRLDIVQLHGAESPQYCEWLKQTYGVVIIKTFAAKADITPQEVETLFRPYTDFVDYFMLDTFDPLVGGGTGKSFAWECIPTYQRWTQQVNVPLIIAGGLQVDNVSRLISDYHPDGVDVSSGVEVDGHKDKDKIAAFVERVNGA